MSTKLASAGSRPARATFIPGKIAYKVEELASAGGPGRTALFIAIREGDLKARKYGSATFILWDDYLAFISALPLAREVA